ncbi:Phosphomevalonate kinase, peroxisomal [Camellia lanceoleosa]|uniref:Phosphomevalonate kinase, peroxisomal n=1 Tax=Camellia lanceoleosa TaxID=1840588 RepID=A0ACC0HBY7_9ERIC|nr:Phosphomevalonate kinase, peroxisomal [Camellia lanceoleosa]
MGDERDPLESRGNSIIFSESRNPFVEYAVQYAVAAALATLEKDKKDLLHKLLLQDLDITILGCNDFYSYRNQFKHFADKVIVEEQVEDDE